MKISFLATGEELLDGRVTNTNQTFIAKTLLSQGFQLKQSITVGDDIEDIKSAISLLLSSHDVLIISGGLGPTEDDRTSQAVAESLGLSLQLDPHSLDRIKAFFASQNRPMASSNQKQAMLPKGSIVIDNENGTAPGYYLKKENRYIFVFPGVPKELHPMFQTVIHVLNTVNPALPPVIETLHCFGLGESAIADALKSLYPLKEGVQIGYRASFPFVHVQIRIHPLTVNAAQLGQELKNKVAGLLKEAVFGFNQDTFIGKFFQVIRQKHRTLAVAESCTGGLVGHLITSEPGASDLLMASLVTYSTLSKIEILGVNPETIRAYGAVSPEVAEEMALHVRSLAQSDLGLSVTGIAGPDGGTKDTPVGTVFIGFSTKYGTSHHRFMFYGDRHRIQWLAAYHALNTLRLIQSALPIHI